MLSLDSQAGYNNMPLLLHNAHVQVRCFDWDADGSHDLIGQFTMTLGDLTRAAEGDGKV